MTTAKPPRRGVPQPLHGGPQRFGPYLLEARLAAGGSSEVFLARAAVGALGAGAAGGPADRLVVKRLLPHLVAEAEGRTLFEREAALHAAVSHPNVVSVYESGVTEQGEPYLAMEYVEGCDAFRLAHRAAQGRAGLPVGLGVFITREVLDGLAAVHDARDAAGAPLGIVHRDVTPSNLYLSVTGQVKLGDFGLARSRARPPVRPPTDEAQATDASLMGKFSYLAPEQVAGEPADHRADLFSVATILAELIIGGPLFPGTGQLQVLLAIRDCKLQPLRDARARLPAGLLPVLERALARDPADRFPDAAAFSLALAPFVDDAAAQRRDLAARVAAVRATPSEPSLVAVAPKPVAPPRPAAPAAARKWDSPTLRTDELVHLEVDAEPEEDDDAHLRTTGVYPLAESFVLHASGERTGPWNFAHLVEAVAAGVVGRGDRVDFIGRGLLAIEKIPELVWLLPAAPATAASPAGAEGAGGSDRVYAVDLAKESILAVLAHVLVTRQSGLLALERPARDAEARQRREAFFLRGRLHHVASSKASELLGEFLVRRGKLAREELDLALAVLPRYGGRMGDTLIGLGLVDGVDIFRALREQGRDRLTALFSWREGSARFDPEAEVPAVDFPLDLDVATLMLEGLEASQPGDAPLAFLESRLDAVILPSPHPELAAFTWPPVVTAVKAALSGPMPLRELVTTVTRSGTASGADVARAVEILLALDLAAWA